LDMVLEASPSAREAYSLLQEFRRILTERRANALRSWLEQAARSSLAPLRGFARSLEQDMDAVMNALTYPWSNGCVWQDQNEENGHVRMRTIRGMHGDARRAR